jgi:[amino group carrier protein]-L-2-aminoadipate 6-kinase
MLVVKVGGSQGIDLDALADDAAHIVREGTKLAIVHGGSHETNRIAEALGHPPRFVTSPSGYSSRVTDRATLEIFEMVYCGKVNKSLVESLQRRGRTRSGSLVSTEGFGKGGARTRFGSSRGNGFAYFATTTQE